MRCVFWRYSCGILCTKMVKMPHSYLWILIRMIPTWQRSIVCFKVGIISMCKIRFVGNWPFQDGCQNALGHLLARLVNIVLYLVMNTKRIKEHVTYFAFILLFKLLNTLKTIIITISIQPEGWFWQEPEPCQVTGMALAHCILGSFLGVGCHCFPPPLDVPTFATRCLHVQATWETSISKRRNYGREMAGQFCLWFRLPHKPRVLWHAVQICDMGDGFTSPPRKACCGFFSPEKSDGFGRDRTRDLGYQRPAC